MQVVHRHGIRDTNSFSAVKNSQVKIVAMELSEIMVKTLRLGQASVIFLLVYGFKKAIFTAIFEIFRSETATTDECD